jgi:hypothetical protein
VVGENKFSPIMPWQREEKMKQNSRDKYQRERETGDIVSGRQGGFSSIGKREVEKG